MTKFTSFIGAAFVAASALAISAPAFAQSDNDQSNRVHVSYRDLDTNTREGQEVLKGRIEAAAVQACGGQVDIRDLTRRAMVNECRTHAYDNAMSQLGSSQVAYAGSTTSGR
jgi:UrcA family protein